MTATRINRIAILLFGAGIFLAGFTLSSATSRDLSVKPEIEAVFKAQELAYANGETAAQLAERFYAPDVVMIGEGDAHTKRGMSAAVDELTQWLKSLGPDGEKGCRFHLEEPLVTSPRIASSFVLLTCKANPPTMPQDQIVRQLFVWKRLPQGWRVALEMWAMGGL